MISAHSCECMTLHDMIFFSCACDSCDDLISSGLIASTKKSSTLLGPVALLAGLESSPWSLRVRTGAHQRKLP